MTLVGVSAEEVPADLADEAVRIPLDLPLPRRLWRWSSELRARRRGADVALVHDFGAAAAVAGLGRDVPIVQKVVGSLGWERARRLGRFRGDLEAFERASIAGVGLRLAAVRGAVRRLARRAARTVVPSRYLASVVERWGVPPDRIEVVPNAVSPALPLEAEPLDRPTGPVLLFVGRLVPWKGVEDAVAAAARVDGATLWVAGDGPLRSAVEGRPGVRRLGALAPADLARAYRAADLLLLPSRYEGLPHAVVEALAFGLPVVATAVGGTPEVLTDGVEGRLVPPGDVEALAAAVRSVLAARRLHAEAARRRAADFSFERMVERYEAILRSAAEPGPAVA